MEDKNNLTLADVAVAAGVSMATVSRFFSNPDVVAEKTAERIRKVVSQSGYTPNKLAGGLASQKSNTVSILIPQLVPSVFSEPIETVVKHLSASGRTVMLGLTEFDSQRTESLVMTALSQRAESIILTGDISDSVRSYLEKSNTTVIEIWGLPKKPIDIAIGLSHRTVGKNLANYLVDQGYQRPHFFTSRGARAQERFSGFQKQWQQFSSVPVSTSELSMPLAPENLCQAFNGLQKLRQLPDAVVCGTDKIAYSIINDAKAAGFRVPEDIAVVGFGNSSQCEEVTPGITSVNFNGEQLAKHILDVLHSRREGKSIAKRKIALKAEIIQRGSA